MKFLFPIDFLILLFPLPATEDRKSKYRKLTVKLWVSLSLQITGKTFTTAANIFQQLSVDITYKHTSEKEKIDLWGFQ